MLALRALRVWDLMSYSAVHERANSTVTRRTGVHEHRNVTQERVRRQK